MSVIYYILDSIKKRKFRTCLIILSIILSSAMFYAFSLIETSVEKVYINEAREVAGDFDLQIYPNYEDYNQVFYPINQREFEKLSIEYFNPVIDVYGTLIDKKKSPYCRVYGIEFEALSNFFVDVNSTEDFVKNKVIINKEFAKKYSLNINDKLKISIENQTYEFLVYDIVKIKGLFKNSKFSDMVIVPYKTLATIYSKENQATHGYIKIKGDKSNIVAKLKDLIPTHIVEDSINFEDIHNYVSSMTQSFIFILIFIVIVSIFIIYTSYKVIVYEKIKVLATFRSIGASKKLTTILLLFESTIYGVVGGLIGSLLGVLILNLMGKNLTNNIGYKIQIIYPYQLIVTFFFAIGITLVSSIIPTIKVSKYSIKDMILEIHKIDYFYNRTMAIVGSSLITLIFVFLWFFRDNVSIILGISLILMLITGIILIVPVYIKIFINGVENFLKVFKGKISGLSLKNLKNNIEVRNTIILFSLSLATLITISNVSYSVIGAISNYYDSGKYQVYFTMNDTIDENTLKKIENIEGVKDIFGSRLLRNITVNNERGFEVILIENNEYFDYWDVNFEQDREKVMNELYNKRGVIISKTLQRKEKLKLGDTINIQFNDNNYEYKILGITNNINNLGKVIMLPYNYIKEDYKEISYDSVLIKGDNPEKIKDSLYKKYSNYGAWVNTIEEQKVNYLSGTKQLYTLINGFMILATIAILLGVINNLMVNFISRVRGFAVMYSIGMSKKQGIKLVIYEAIGIGSISVFLGIFISMILSSIMDQVMLIIGAGIRIHFDSIVAIFLVIGTILVSILASIGAVIRMKSLNIIDEIKYE